MQQQTHLVKNRRQCKKNQGGKLPNLSIRREKIRFDDEKLVLIPYTHPMISHKNNDRG
jgi:hypothetical protein